MRNMFNGDQLTYDITLLAADTGATEPMAITQALWEAIAGMDVPFALNAFVLKELVWAAKFARNGLCATERKPNSLVFEFCFDRRGQAYAIKVRISVSPARVLCLHLVDGEGA